MRQVAVRAAAERRRVRGQRQLVLQRRAGVTVGAADRQLRLERLGRIDGRQDRSLQLGRRVGGRGKLQDLPVGDRADDALAEEGAPAGDRRGVSRRARESSASTARTDVAAYILRDRARARPVTAWRARRSRRTRAARERNPAAARASRGCAGRRAARAGPRPDRSSPAAVGQRPAPPSASRRSSQGASAASEPDQFSSASPGAARIVGTLIGLTRPRVRCRTRRRPGVARGVIAGHRHVEPELARQILAPGARQQQARAHRASRGKSVGAPVFDGRRVPVVEHGGRRQQQAIVEARRPGRPSTSAPPVGFASPWQSQQVIPICPVGLPSGPSGSRSPSTPVDADTRPRRPRGSSGVRRQAEQLGVREHPALGVDVAGDGACRVGRRRRDRPARDRNRGRRRGPRRCRRARSSSRRWC